MSTETTPRLEFDASHFDFLKQTTVVAGPVPGLRHGCTILLRRRGRLAGKRALVALHDFFFTIGFLQVDPEQVHDP